MSHDWTAHRERLRSAQLEALRQHATGAGDPFPLFYFLALTQDQSAVSEAILSTPAENPVRGLFSDILRSAPPSGDVGFEELPFTTASWFAYAFTHQALAADDLGRAVAMATCLLLKKKQPYVGALNLIGYHLLAMNDATMAEQFFDRSLRIAPRQLDIAQRIAAIRAGKTPQVDAPDLEPFPETVRPFGFYLPVFNAAQFLPMVIPAILRQSYPLDTFIMVDDGSTDTSCEIAADFPVQIIHHARNKGLAAARNTAFSTLPSDYVACCDSDVRLDPNYLLHVDLELRTSHAPLAAVGGRMTEEFRDTPPDRYRSLYINQDTSTQRRHLNTELLDSPVNAEPLNELYLPGCNTVMKRSAVLAVGGYDEQYRTACEDGDIYRKLAAAGHPMSTVPEARAYHLRRDTTDSILQMDWRYIFWPLREEGLFQDIERIRSYAETSRVLLRERLLHTASANSPEINFIHLTCYAYRALRTYEEAQVLLTISTQERLQLQHDVLNALKELDQVHGGKLYDRLYPFLRLHMVPGNSPYATEFTLCDLIDDRLYASMEAYDERRVLEALSEAEHLN